MPKRNREREYTNRFCKAMRKGGARAIRFRDDEHGHPYDGYVFYNGIYMPYEAKFCDGGLTYNVDIWRRDQPHQYENLDRDHWDGAKPFLLLFWKRNNRVYWKVCRFSEIESKITIDLLPEARDIQTLWEIV